MQTGCYPFQRRSPFRTLLCIRTPFQGEFVGGLFPSAESLGYSLFALRAILPLRSAEPWNENILHRLKGENRIARGFKPWEDVANHSP